jgi:FkbM family methyltransferase
MNKFYKNLLFILSLPLLIKIKGKSILHLMSHLFLKPDEKAEIFLAATYQGLANRMGNKVFQLTTLVKSLNTNTPLYERFFSNFVKNNGLFESQLAQDCFVDTVLNNKKNGVFIEIGVGDGISLSNTYFLEKFRGWNGLLCEPSKIFHTPIFQHRNATLVKSAVLGSGGQQVNFVEVKGREMLSTLKKYSDLTDHNRDHYIEYTVDTITFTDLCRKYLSGNKIDYLSIDTEGSELEIIVSIDFDLFDISVISVEHNNNPQKLSHIQSILTKKNYVEVPIFSWDCMFVKKELMVG